MSFGVYQKNEELKHLIRSQYAYGFNRQSGILAHRGGGLSISDSVAAKDDRKGVQIKRQFPLHRKNKARRSEHFTRTRPEGLGHPLVRSAFVTGSPP